MLKMFSCLMQVACGHDPTARQRKEVKETGRTVNFADFVNSVVLQVI